MTEPSISLLLRYALKKDVLVRDLDGEAVLLDLASGRYFGLNETGNRVLQLTDGRRTLADIRDRLLEEFAVEPGEIEADLIELVRELEREGLVERVG